MGCSAVPGYFPASYLNGTLFTLLVSLVFHGFHHIRICEGDSQMNKRFAAEQ